jgi:hypothetical protein
LPRGFLVGEVYSDTGIVVPSAFVTLSPLSLPAAWTHYAVLIVGLVLVGIGRHNRVGIVMFLVPSSLLMLHEALNIKGYDRLLLWQGLVLLAAPGGGRGDRAGSPFAQYSMLLIYVGLYGSNGWFKILRGSDWWHGTTLAYALVDQNFGGRALGLWLSDKVWLTIPLSWWTVLFEAGFPILVWFGRVRAWLLLSGVALHVGIALTMHLNTFGLIVLAGYPVLLGDRGWIAFQLQARSVIARVGASWAHHGQ